jgi:DNA-binding CsgD family transcriptional regulator
MEFMSNTAFHVPFLLAITFYSLASATVAMALFIYDRKIRSLMHSVVLYACFFLAFTLYLLKNEEIVKIIRAGQETVYLSKINVLLLLILEFGLIIFDTISLRKTMKGFIDARADIEASVKALIPSNSVWKPDLGLTEAIITQYRITEAEQTVANLVLLGQSNKEIASALHKAVGTVEAQLKSIYQKTGVAGRYALISLAAQSATAQNGEEIPLTQKPLLKI